MLQKPKCPVIALEEHYWDEELAAHAKAVERKADITNRLFDMGELRLKEMDEAGIDIQVISHGAPSAQKLSGPEAPAIAARVNDRLAAVVKDAKTRQLRVRAYVSMVIVDPDDGPTDPVRVAVTCREGDPPLRVGMSTTVEIDTGHSRSIVRWRRREDW